MSAMLPVLRRCALQGAFFSSGAQVRALSSDASLSSKSGLTDYPGLAQPLPADIQAKLNVPLDPKQVAIKPDGVVYVSQHFYRRILNDVFGIGGWAIIPRGESVITEGEVLREYALFAHGQFLAQACGDHPRLASALLGDPTESCRSNALVRCCKDLGIAGVLWDPEFVQQWKSEYAVQAWCTHAKTGEKRQIWRLKTASFAYPWKESESAATSSFPTKPASSFSAPPPAREFEGADDPFDPDAIVPPVFKKQADGKKTWIQLLSSPDGRKYLKYFVNEKTSLAPAAQRALDYWETNMNDDFPGV